MVISQGAALQSLLLIRAGMPDLPLIWSLGGPHAYNPNPRHVGAVIGRVAGRIKDGQFKIGMKKIQLETNEGPNTLHGGPRGLSQINWNWAGKASFSISSPNSDQGFPGGLNVRATYSLPDDLTLRLDLAARSLAPTPVNLTHHPYWQLFASSLTVHGTNAQAVDDNLIPTGGYVVFKPDLNEPLDHCVLVEGNKFRELSRLTHSEAGFAMTVWSDSSHAQIYNGQEGYLCIEPQSANDAVNQSDEPSCLLKPGQLWRRRIEYRFEV